jgi:hypothetical protein
MRAPDGAFSIGDFHGRQLGHVEYMRSEELLSVGDDGKLHALGDMLRDEAARKYPGAPVPDSCRRASGAHTCVNWPDGERCASFGKQLRGAATGKVLAALFNISRGGVVRWSRKRKQQVIEAPGGLRLSAAQVCAEANQLLAANPVFVMTPKGPQKCRYLSVSTCREVIKALIELGHITEAIGAKAIRRMRSWFTLPRVIGRVMEDLSGRADIIGAVTRWRKQASASSPSAARTTAG